MIFFPLADLTRFNKESLWKTFTVFMTIVVFFPYPDSVYNPTLIDNIHQLLDSLCIFALWGLWFKKKIFFQMFWQCLIFLSIIILFIHLPFFEVEESYSILFYLLLVMFYIPFYYRVIRYSFFSNSIWDK